MTKKNDVPQTEIDSDIYEVIESIVGVGDFKIDEHFIEQARRRAEEACESLAVLFKKAVQLGSGLDLKSWSTMEVFADQFKLTPAQILNVLLMRARAEWEAGREVHGEDAPDLFEDAFMWDGDGLITGETLFENFKRDFKGELRRKRIREIGERLAQAGNRLDLLPETDREFYQEYLDSIKNVKARAPKEKKPRRMATRE
jgi:hypothetical protein